MEDDVEWPADINIEDHRITPEELIEFSSIDVLDSEPSFYNNPDDYSATYVDILVDLDVNTLVLGREWTVENSIFEFEWNYTQKIIIDISNFDNLITVNTGTNRAMSGVVFNEDISTNSQGIAYVEDFLVNSIEYEDEVLNGLNVLDLLLIQAHILDYSELTGYSLQAADINDGESITAADLVQLRKIILGIESEDHVDWRFYEQEVSGPISINPKAVYLGVKNGDVDDSALLPGDLPPATENDLFIRDIVLNKGEMYMVPVFIKDGNYTAMGLDFRAQMDRELIDIVNITSEYAIEQAYHVQDNGKLGYVFGFPDDSFDIDNSTPIMMIELIAKENGLLSASINLEERVSYIVDANYELIVLGGEVGEVIGTGINSPELDGLLVYPNPATDFLKFDRSETSLDGEIEIHIYDMFGRKITTQRNTDQINLSNLATGMYYYEYKIDTYKTTGKFVVN